jgi:hypothetical protein
MPLSAKGQAQRRARIKKLETPKIARRRKCLNCDELFRPERPYPVQKFCKDACRKEFHANGGNAFGPLKARLEKLVLKQTAELTRQVAILRTRVEMLEDAGLAPLNDL